MSDNADKKQIATMQKHFEECFSMRQCLGGLSGQACTAPTISSHTIAKRWLKQIARRGHVYSQEYNIFNRPKVDPSLGLSLVGVNKATTYQLFCLQHDSELFRGVELTAFEANARSAALLQFRAVCREAFTKVGATTLMRTVSVDPANKELSEFHRYLSIGHEAGLRDAAIHYHHERTRVHEGSFDHIRFYAANFPCVLPFAFVGAFFPEIDFDGNRLLDLAQLDKTAEALGVACFSDEGRAYLVLTWDKYGQRARQLATSFHKLDNEKKAGAALILGFEFVENVALSPDWWEGLRPSTRSELLHRLRMAGSPWEPHDDRALCNPPLLPTEYSPTSWRTNEGAIGMLR